MTPPTAADVERARQRLAGVARVTPVVRSATFSELAGRDVWLKAENLQRTGSFKVRGAVNRIAATHRGGARARRRRRERGQPRAGGRVGGARGGRACDDRRPPERADGEGGGDSQLRRDRGDDRRELRGGGGYGATPCGEDGSGLRARVRGRRCRRRAGDSRPGDRRATRGCGDGGGAGRRRWPRGRHRPGRRSDAARDSRGRRADASRRVRRRGRHRGQAAGRAAAVDPRRATRFHGRGLERRDRAGDRARPRTDEARGGRRGRGRRGGGTGAAVCEGSAARLPSSSPEGTSTRRP